MSAQYPIAIYDPRLKENAAGIVYEEALSDRIYVEDVSSLDDEVVAIETELGASPKGSDADVAARLLRIDNALDAVEVFNNYIIKQADQIINNSTTITDDDTLVVPVSANSVYLIELCVRAQILANSDFKWSVTVPSRYTVGLLYTSYPTFDIVPLGFNIEYPVLVSSLVNRCCRIVVSLQTGSDAGNVKFRWAQNTAQSENTKVLKGSFARWVKLL